MNTAKGDRIPCCGAFSPSHLGTNRRSRQTAVKERAAFSYSKTRANKRNNKPNKQTI